jgi:cytochrome bd-type quinol oxidase subunit 1
VSLYLNEEDAILLHTWKDDWETAEFLFRPWKIKEGTDKWLSYPLTTTRECVCLCLFVFVFVFVFAQFYWVKLDKSLRHRIKQEKKKKEEKSEVYFFMQIFLFHNE